MIRNCLLVLFLSSICSLMIVSGFAKSYVKVLSLRGGLVPEAEDDNGNGVGVSYYDKYELDYGSDDTQRFAGAMRGFLPSGKLSALPESDPFLKWWNQYLENGPDEELEGRLKPFYAADFGEKSELKKGEHPKVIVVQRELKTDKHGVLLPSPKGVDVEVREIWQPWLRHRCNFAVRYIVPSRINIIKILETRGRFKSLLEIEEEQSKANASQRTAWTKIIFKPSLKERLIGRKEVEIKRRLDSRFLFSDSKDLTKTKIKTVAKGNKGPLIRQNTK